MVKQVYSCFARRRQTHRQTSPDFRYSRAAPGGLPREHCRVTRRLRGERQVVVGDCDFPECFTRCSRTWARNQSFTNPVEASHPRYNT